MNSSVFSYMLEALKRGSNVMLACIIASKGSTPRTAGAKMLLTDEGQTFGTIGGGEMEHYALGHAKMLLSKQTAQLHSFPILTGREDWGSVTIAFLPIIASEATCALITHVLDSIAGHKPCYLFIDEIMDASPKFSFTDSMPETQSKRYVERLNTARRTVIFGAGHVACALASVLHLLGRRTVIVDARRDYANSLRFPHADKIHVVTPSEASAKLELSSFDNIAVLLGNPTECAEIVKHALQASIGYIGLLGSGKKIDSIKNMLIEAGITQSEVERIHAPIGLNIGAQTPEEIAVSIAAEMINAGK